MQGLAACPKRIKAAIFQIIVKAARSVGRRVVIAKFWEEPSEFHRSDDVFFIGKYPHLKLFPRMAAVIHHGGAGTVATSAISGIQQIVVPHFLDQYYWGSQIYRSNLGPNPIWRSRLTSRKLEVAIHEALSHKRMKQKATAISRMIDRQNSLDMAVRELLRGV